MRFPGNVVTLEDTRSGGGAGTPDKCLYCKAPTGGPHTEECVCIERPVKIRMTVELIITHPRSWDAGSINFHLNDSSWCANNILGELDRLAGGGRCLCSATEFEFIGDATLEEAVEQGLKPDAEHEDSEALEDARATMLLERERCATVARIAGQDALAEEIMRGPC